MLDFEDILEKYKLSNKKSIDLILGKVTEDEEDIKELRRSLTKNICKYSDNVFEARESKREQEEKLLSEIMLEIDLDFIKKIYSFDKEKTLHALDDLMNSRLYIHESKKKLEDIKGKIDSLKNERKEYEENIVREVKVELKKTIKNDTEVEFIGSKVKEIGVLYLH